MTLCIMILTVLTHNNFCEMRKFGLQGKTLEVFLTLRNDSENWFEACKVKFKFGNMLQNKSLVDKIQIYSVNLFSEVTTNYFASTDPNYCII